MIGLALFVTSLFGLCYGTRERTGIQRGVWLACDVITHVVSVARPMSLSRYMLTLMLRTQPSKLRVWLYRQRHQ
jgi:hypothetical protein